MNEEKVIQYLEERVLKNPKSLLFARLADCYLSRGCIEEAIKLCNEGIKHHPDYITGYFILSKAYLIKEDYEKAESELKRVLSRDRQFVTAHKLLADLMMRMGWENTAAMHYKDILKLDPLNSGIRTLLSTLNLPQITSPAEELHIEPDFLEEEPKGKNPHHRHEEEVLLDELEEVFGNTNAEIPTEKTIPEEDPNSPSFWPEDKIEETEDDEIKIEDVESISDHSEFISEKELTSEEEPQDIKIEDIDFEEKSVETDIESAISAVTSAEDEEDERIDDTFLESLEQELEHQSETDTIETELSESAETDDVESEIKAKRPDSHLEDQEIKIEDISPVEPGDNQTDIKQDVSQMPEFLSSEEMMPEETIQQQTPPIEFTDESELIDLEIPAIPTLSDETQSHELNDLDSFEFEEPQETVSDKTEEELSVPELEDTLSLEDTLDQALEEQEDLSVKDIPEPAPDTSLEETKETIEEELSIPELEDTLSLEETLDQAQEEQEDISVEDIPEPAPDTSLEEIKETIEEELSVPELEDTLPLEDTLKQAQEELEQDTSEDVPGIAVETSEEETDASEDTKESELSEPELEDALSVEDTLEQALEEKESLSSTEDIPELDTKTPEEASTVDETSIETYGESEKPEPEPAESLNDEIEDLTTELEIEKITDSAESVSDPGTESIVEEEISHSESDETDQKDTDQQDDSEIEIDDAPVFEPELMTDQSFDEPEKTESVDKETENFDDLENDFKEFEDILIQESTEEPVQESQSQNEDSPENKNLSDEIMEEIDRNLEEAVQTAKDKEKDLQDLEDLSSSPGQTSDSNLETSQVMDDSDSINTDKSAPIETKDKTKEVDDQSEDLKEDTIQEETEFPQPDEEPKKESKIVSPTLGEIYAAQGEYAKAIKVYEVLLEKDPNEKKYQKKLDELRQRLESKDT